jgi:site-specific DNA recombinase
MDTGIKYCLYARKSTEQEDKQALSIESQVNEMLALAEREKLNVVEIKRESHSSKEVGRRPIYNQMLAEIRQQKFNAILTWAPDRLSRNAGDLGSIVDMMDQKLLIEIQTYSQKFTNNPNEKFLLMILGSQAKLENDNRMINIKRGMRARCEMGLWPTTAPTGYLNSKRTDQKCQVFIDPLRAPVIKQMFEKVAYEKWSGRRLYIWLKDEIRFKTKTGKPLSIGNVYLILKNHFYYGIFEYPRGSGNWYVGKHTPIISKELFDRVQETIKEHIVRSESKEFAFTKMIACGACGSSITADEKFKKQLNGNIHRYVYYGCTKSNDKSCKSGYMREEDLIEQLAELMDKIELDETGIRAKVKAEVERHKKFQAGMLGIRAKVVKVSDIDIRNYAKYVLRDGMLIEKRELLSCLKRIIIGSTGSNSSSSSDSATSGDSAAVTTPTSVDQNKIISSVVNIWCSDGSDGDLSGGSGTLWTSEGMILTNAHIIPQDSDQNPIPAHCIVTLPNSSGSAKDEYLGEPIIIPDISKEYDLAFIKIDGPYTDSNGVNHGPYPTTFPDYQDFGCYDNDVTLSEPVTVFGYPEISNDGNSLTVTTGVVSSIPGDGTIVTSAKVDHGDSGGLAVDENGCMIGVPSMISGDGDESLGIIKSYGTVQDFLNDVHDWANKSD